MFSVIISSFVKCSELSIVQTGIVEVTKHKMMRGVGSCFKMDEKDQDLSKIGQVTVHTKREFSLLSRAQNIE